jgi:Mg2+-importing ATPase
MPGGAVLGVLGGDHRGLTDDEAARRRARFGPNVVRTHRVSAWAVFGRQLRSGLLGLLLVAATVSFFVGERTDALVIGVILAVSVGLGFGNEYRAERAGAALQNQVRYRAAVLRDGAVRQVDVAALVPGDVVRLRMGAVVPADLRLLAVEQLSCDEAVLTGESVPVSKQADPVPAGAPVAELASCALMGTVVAAGSATGVVVATGARSQFGKIAAGLATGTPPTEFQLGLRRFGLLLARVAGVLTALILVINLVLDRPVIDAVLFSLAIAVGITPQLLPAVVTTSLATGSRRLAARRVLVKRFVCVEDLGNVEVLFTDKTGTLTEGRISLAQTIGADGSADEQTLRLGLLATETTPDEATTANPLDAALWQAPGAAGQRGRLAGYHRVAVCPFDHHRRRVSVLVDGPDGRLLVTKGSPEELLARCRDVPAQTRAVVDEQLTSGARVIAVATRPAPELTGVLPADEQDLTYAGLLIFHDPPKQQVRPALAKLATLGVTVKIITGDHPAVAARLCQQLGLTVTGVLTGAELATITEAELPAAIAATTVFARVSPEDKARLVAAQRRAGRDVGFLGDGVNDALALHAADIGISVDTATDVAKEAADVLLLEKDLGVLAEGVTEGRRIFANTIKYVLMSTSSNFGNMFSAAAASAFLPFLPMLPSQILLNNLIYDLTQIAIPTDRVDADQLARPAHWNLREIRRFMLTFGPLSSLFDFLTFAILLQALHATATGFRTGWFIESLATQALVVFVIRTHTSPFWRSGPSRTLSAAVAAGVTAAVVLPYTPLAAPLGFTPLPVTWLLVLAVPVAAYLTLVELVKRPLFTAEELHRPAPKRTVVAAAQRHTHRRLARFAHWRHARHPTP